MSETEKLAKQKLLKALLAKKLNEKNTFDLSNSQKRFLYLSKAEGEIAAYNLPVALRYTGKLDEPVFKSSLVEVVRRHEVLSVRFSDGEGSDYKQTVDVNAELDYEYLIDELGPGTYSDELAIQRFVEKWIAEQVEIPFRFESDKLIRFRLLKVSEEEHIFLLNVHHIIWDDQSLNIFFRELSYVYGEKLRDENFKLNAAEVQYHDYVQWEEAWQASKAASDQLQYWEKKLGGIPLLTDLPLDHPRPSQTNYQAKEKTVFELGEETTKKIESVCAREGISMLMFLMTTYSILLNVYTNQKDIVVGTPASKRAQKEFESLVGLFVNTLAIRSQISSNLRLSEIFSATKETMLDALKNKMVPFDQVVENLAPTRSRSFNPLFQVMLAYYVHRDEDFSLEGIETNFLYTPHNISNFDLTQTFHRNGDVIAGLLEYNTELFEEGTIKRFTNIFVKLVEAVCELDGTQTLTQLYSKVFNENDAFQKNAHSEQSERKGLGISAKQTLKLSGLAGKPFSEIASNIAVQDADRSVSYKELDTLSNSLANYMCKHYPVSAEDRVAICMSRSAELLTAIIGVMKAGVCFVPIPVDIPLERKKHIICDADVKLLLHRGECQELVDGEIVTSVNVAENDCKNESEVFITQERAGNSLAYILYTSGSTGKPKGVGVSAEAFLSLNEWHTKRFSVNENSIAVFSSSIGFDAFIWETFPYLSQGAKLNIVSDDVKIDVYQYAQWLSKNAITHCFLPTAIAERMFSLIPDDMPLPETILIGGDELHESTRQNMRYRTSIYNAYGLTETAVVCTIGAVNFEPGAKITIGKATDNASIFIVDEDFIKKPIGVSGQIAVGGRCLARSYLGDPRTTAEKFVPNPFSDIPGDRMFLSGDGGRMLETGEIAFLGRLDNQVSIDGIRIEPSEIEHAITHSSDAGELAVKECAVLVREDLGNNKRLEAYLVAENKETFCIQELKVRLSELLPRYMLPSSIFVLDEMPVTVNGKLDRKKLSALGLKDMGESVAINSETEKRIRDIWHKVLKCREDISAESNFFEVGGNSLQAVEIANAIANEFEISFAVGDIFNHPSITTLADTLEARLAMNATSEGVNTISSRPKETRIPLSYTQERLWVLEQLSEERNSYGVPICTYVEGELDLDCLKQAFEHVLNKHEIFRTCFPQDEFGPYQLIQEEFTLPFRIIDQSDSSQSLRDWYAGLGKNREVFEKKFDLLSGDLLEIVYVKGRANEHILSVNMHHIVVDGWSLNALISEVFDAYGKLIGSRELDANVPVLQYADYAYWQRSSDNDEAKLGEAYWKQRLHNKDPIIQVPLDGKLFGLSQPIAKHLHVKLSHELTEKIDLACRYNTLTPYMFFMASLSLLLYQYSKQENILIHSISANREHKQLKSVLGPFINTLCFAWQINSNLSLGQYLEQVKEHCLEGFKYQSIPYEKVQGVLQGNMISDSNRGIDAMFVMQNIPRIDSEISDVRFSGLDSFVEGVKYDLDVEVTKLGEGEEEVYSVQFTYNAGKLQSNFIQKLLQHFKELLAEMSVCAIEMKVDRGASQARKQLIDISPLCLEEKDKLIQLSAIGKAKHFQENTIVSCVDAITEQRENQICLLHNGDSLTYGELNKSANRLANHLFSIGIQAGDRVGLCIPRSFDSVVAMLAILKTGAAYVPLDTEYPKSRLQHIVDDAKLKCILAHKNNEALVSSLHDHSIYVDEASSLIAQSSERIQNTNIHPEQIAYVIYTSGSTGTPVGVSIPHRALINHVQWISKAYPFNVNERACHKTSINFVDSVAEIWSPILQGTEVSIVDQAEVIDLTHFVKKLADENISRIVLVPSLLKALLTSFENLAQKLPNLRTVMCGGEEVSPSLANLFFDLLPNVEMINIYGASEVASDVTSYRINDMKNHFDQGEIISSVPIGRAIDNCSVMVLDDNLNLCPVGVQGVLYASGEPLAAHYVGRSALSAESFIPNPYSNDPGARMYCLGDVGCLTESGEIKYFGREGNQVKVNGNRVNLSEVEKYLARIEFVKDMVVLSDINQSGKTEIRAFVVVSKENIAAAEIENDIFKYLSEFLPAYMIPSQISVLEDFPYLPNGKVDKRELAAKVQGSKPNRIIIAPRNQFDETLLSMWLAITETDSISIDDKLFEVGGDSIALIRFHSAISTSSDPLLKDRNIDIKISDFFKLTTIRLISDHIEGASGKEIEHESIQKIADEKRKRLKNRRVKRDIKV